MPGQVRVDTARMTAVGREAQDISQRIRAEAQAIDNACTNLIGDGWRGDAATAAKEVALAQQTRARQLVDVLDGHGDATMRGSTALAGQEETATSRMRGVGGGIGSAINQSV
jgi:WXG100 family type VII secretion target